MTTIELIMAVILGSHLIWSAIYRGKVRMENQLLHNRISALADEALRQMVNTRKDVEFIAKNAQSIASNALSSAQRAESKIAKHTDESIKATEQITNA